MSESASTGPSPTRLAVAMVVIFVIAPASACLGLVVGYGEIGLRELVSGAYRRGLFITSFLASPFLAMLLLLPRSATGRMLGAIVSAVMILAVFLVWLVIAVGIRGV